MLANCPHVSNFFAKPWSITSYAWQRQANERLIGKRWPEPIRGTMNSVPLRHDLIVSPESLLRLTGLARRKLVDAALIVGFIKPVGINRFGQTLKGLNWCNARGGRLTRGRRYRWWGKRGLGTGSSLCCWSRWRGDTRECVLELGDACAGFVKLGTHHRDLLLRVLNAVTRIAHRIGKLRFHGGVPALQLCEL